MRPVTVTVYRLDNLIDQHGWKKTIIKIKKPSELEKLAGFAGRLYFDISDVPLDHELYDNIAILTYESVDLLTAFDHLFSCIESFVVNKKDTPCA